MRVTGSEGSLCLSVGLKRKKNICLCWSTVNTQTRAKVHVQKVLKLDRCWCECGDWCLIKSSNSSMLSDSTNCKSSGVMIKA